MSCSAKQEGKQFCIAVKCEVFDGQTCSLQSPVHVSFLVNYCSLIHFALIGVEIPLL